MALNVVQNIDDRVPVRNVLVSVSDKRGLDSFVPGLLEAVPRVKLYSTGGTYSVIESLLGKKAKSHLVPVSDYTGQPEMQGGLVKTLDFKIYLGLLSEKYNKDHRDDLKRTGAVSIDMVVVNLYPFQATISKPGATPEDARGNIDIGGPCMVRAAAKNFIRVASVVDPADYRKVLKSLNDGGGTIPLSLRYNLARKAFAHTAGYDAAIAGYFASTTFPKVRKEYTLKDKK